MKKPIIFLALALITLVSKAQIGIGTTTPLSSLDVAGSFGTKVRTFTSAYTADITDCNLIFTGTSVTTLTLPDATTITGRWYVIKNASSNASTLNIATTSSQFIDAVTSQSLTSAYQTMTVVSNGTGWNIMAYGLPSASGTSWSQGGNGVSGETTLGTTTSWALPFITANTERMRISSTGNVAIGTTSFTAANPEKFLVHTGAASTTAFINAIVARGNSTKYVQLNVQNINSGTAASTDVVATSNNGDETKNYIDMGINSSGNNQDYFGNQNDGYLFIIGDGANAGGNLSIGTSTADKDIILLTGGGASANERVRVSSASGNSTLKVKGSVALPITNTTSNMTLDATNYTVIISGGSPTITLPTASSTNEGRIYVIVNTTGAARTITSYQSLNAVGVTTIAANSSITIQSYNNNWWRIQ